MKTKVERIRERFEAKGRPTPPDRFTDEEVLKMAKETFEGNCVLSGIIWEDSIIQLKQSLPKWVKIGVNKFNKIIKYLINNLLFIIIDC